MQIILMVAGVLILAGVTVLVFKAGNLGTNSNESAIIPSGNNNVNNPSELTEPVVKPGDATPKSGDATVKPSETKLTQLTKVQQELLAQLKAAADSHDYATFAQYLKMVYQKLWEGVKEFETVEKDLYVETDKNYFLKGDYGTALAISTTIYNVVPQGWRFRYLRVLVLEKLGREAFAKNDLAGAENYALAILQMMFRPEGANLMGDIYIKKIETDLAAGNIAQAQADYATIKDYEVSAEIRTKLDTLALKIGK